MRAVEGVAKARKRLAMSATVVMFAAALPASLGTMPEASAGPTDVVDLSVVISHSPEPAPAGSDLIFEIKVKNNNPATGATATDVQLATLLYYANGSGTNYWRGYQPIPQDRCEIKTTPQQVESQDVPWTPIKTPVICDLDPISPGNTATVTITMNINALLQGVIALGAGVTAAELDTNPADNAATDAAHVNQSGALL